MIREIVKKLPTKLDGAVEHFHKMGIFTKDYLIYRKGFYYEPLTDLKKNCVDVCCTHCKSKLKMSYATDSKGKMTFFNDLTNKLVEPYQETECPECGHYVTPIPFSAFERDSIHIDTNYLMTIHNIDGALCLLLWHIEKRLSRSGEIKYYTHAHEGNIFSKEGCFKVTSSGSFMGSIFYYGSWTLLRFFYDAIGDITVKHIFPYDKTLIEKSDFPNCKIDKYLEEQELSHPALYMYLYCKFPNIENLLMDLGPNFVQMHIEKVIGFEPGSRRKPKKTLTISKLDLLLDNAKPNEITGLSKEEYKFFKNKQATLFMMRAFSHNKKSFTLNQYNELEKILSNGTINNDTLVELYPFIDKLSGFTLRKAVKYITEQRKLSKKVRITWNYYIDYLTMGKRLKLSYDAFPRNLIEAHDYVLERYNQKLERDRQKKVNKETEKNKAAFEKRFKQLEKFSFAKSDLVIVPCKNEHELFEEGNKLHHCVYSMYKTSHMNGSTAIFFIRKKNENKPFFTVQFDEKNIQILQNRGFKNCDPPDEVVMFTKKWLKYCKKVKENENGKSNTTTKSVISA